MLAAPFTSAQVFAPDDFNPLGTSRSGVRLHSATFSSAYVSGGYGLGLRGISQAAASSQVGMAQASGVLGWSRESVRSTSSVIYSPSFVRGINVSGYRSLNHSLVMSSTRALDSKWTLSASGRALLSDFSQLLFARTRTSEIASVPSTLEQLVSALLTGRSDVPALAAAIGSAPLVSSPETAFIYGDRELSTSAVVSLAYSPSTRSTFIGTFYGVRTQNSNLGTNGSAVSSNVLLPKTTSASGSFSWSYSLTPRTTTAVHLSSTRTMSRIQDSYGTQLTATVGRTLSRRWFVQGMLGAGIVTPVRAAYLQSGSAQQLFGGSVGYKLYAHTLLGSFTRSISDVYGLGASSTDGSSVAWIWKRPGAAWSLSGNFGYSHLRGSAFPNARSLTANGAVSKALDAHTALSIGYTYTRFPPTVFAELPNLSQTGVILSLSWSPSARR